MQKNTRRVLLAVHGTKAVVGTVILIAVLWVHFFG